MNRKRLDFGIFIYLRRKEKRVGEKEESFEVLSSSDIIAKGGKEGRLSHLVNIWKGKREKRKKGDGCPDPQLHRKGEGRRKKMPVRAGRRERRRRGKGGEIRNTGQFGEEKGGRLLSLAKLRGQEKEAARSPVPSDVGTGKKKRKEVK